MESAVSRRPPEGIVTFLYSDIEGSTRMLEQAPDATARAIEEHVTLLEAAIEAGGGQVFRSTGDGLCAAFTAPAGAVGAAARAQRSMAAHGWVGVPPVRVRIAVHTGEAAWLGRDYRGVALFRVARLMALAHGG